jgi:4-amino-4-deoxy-L-arabinose transferase-like glycosyltransferase
MTPGRPGAADLRRLLLFFAAVASIYFFALGTVPLLEPDEARYAEVPREMLASGDFVTPRLNGVVYLEKPPLFYWGNALSMRLFGENEFGARCFTAAVSVAGVALTYWMGSVMGGPRTGLFAAAVLSTSFYHFAVGRLNTLDMTLAVCLGFSFFPAYLYLSGRRRGRAYLVASYAAAGLAFLAKGLVGVVFPSAVLFLWLAAAGRLRDVPRALSLTGILVFLAVCLPWIVLVQRANPDFLWFFFVREHFMRFTTTLHQREAPFWYFVPIALGGLMPWVAFLPAAVRGARRAGRAFLAREDVVFLATWFLFIFLFFSLSRSKLATYAAPLFPPLAVLFGRGLDLWAEGEDGGGRCRLPLAWGGRSPSWPPRRSSRCPPSRSTARPSARRTGSRRRGRRRSSFSCGGRSPSSCPGWGPNGSSWPPSSSRGCSSCP